MSTSPKVFFFDAAGTLMYLPRTVGQHYADVGASCGMKLDPAKLDRAFHTAWKEMPPRPVTADGSARPDDDKGWWRELVRRVLQHPSDGEMQGTLAQTDGKFDFDGYFEVVYDHFARPDVWHAYREVAWVLEKLRARGVRLGVISNFDRRLFTNLEDIGLSAYFDHVTISSEVGADKPHARIFERALSVFGVTAADAMHVGDDPRLDWAGAEAAGLRVFRLERPKNDLRALLEE